MESENQDFASQNPVLSAVRDHTVRTKLRERDILANDFEKLKESRRAEQEASTEKISNLKKVRTQREARCNQLRTELKAKTDECDDTTNKLDLAAEQRDEATETIELKDDLLKEKDIKILSQDDKIGQLRLKVSQLSCELQAHRASDPALEIQRLEADLNSAATDRQVLENDLNQIKSQVDALKGDKKALEKRNECQTKANRKLALESSFFNTNCNDWYWRFQNLNHECQDARPLSFETEKRIQDQANVIIELRDELAKTSEQLIRQNKDMRQMKTRNARNEAKTERAVEVYRKVDEVSKDLRDQNTKLVEELTNDLAHNHVVSVLKGHAHTINAVNNIIVCELDEMREKLDKAETDKASVINRTDWKVNNMTKDRDQALQKFRFYEEQHVNLEMELEMAKESIKERETAYEQIVTSKDQEKNALVREKEHLLAGDPRYRGAKPLVNNLQHVIIERDATVTKLKQELSQMTAKHETAKEDVGGYSSMAQELQVEIDGLKKQNSKLKAKEAAFRAASLATQPVPEPSQHELPAILTSINFLVHGLQGAASPTPSNASSSSEESEPAEINLGPPNRRQSFPGKEKLPLITINRDEKGYKGHNRDGTAWKAAEVTSTPDTAAPENPSPSSWQTATSADDNLENVITGVSGFTGRPVQIIN